MTTEKTATTQPTADQETTPTSGTESQVRTAPPDQDQDAISPEPDVAADAPSAAHPDTGPDTEETGEENDHDPADTDEVEDYTEWSREALWKHLQAADPTAGRTIRAIAQAFEAHVAQARTQALEAFTASEGAAAAADFVFKDDELTERFRQHLAQWQQQQRAQRRQQEQDRDKNLQHKQQLLEELRTLVEAEETKDSQAAIKRIQQQWREAGAVPGAAARDLYASYHVLMDRYYDQRSIYFELKELDRRKNLEAKQELVDKAQQLLALDSTTEAVGQLHELHDTYKEIGPVPREAQETLWQTFKALSDQIHDRHRAFVAQVRQQEEQNLQVKQELVARAQAFGTFESDRIDEWNAQTQALKALEEEWKGVGPLPRKVAQAVSRQFWDAFKEFFARKSQFFKTLEQEREGNLQAKEALCQQAEALSTSDEWRATGDKLKALQQSWREIGPVPIKKRDALNKRFKKAVDGFFRRRRDHFAAADRAQEDSLQRKQQLCAELEKLADAGQGNAAQLEALLAQWAGAGSATRDQATALQRRWDDALARCVQASADVADADKARVLIELQLSGVRQAGKEGGDSQALRHKESQLRQQIQRLEDDISLWKNNLAFFANSKKADELRADFGKKIEAAEAQVHNLRAQLKLVRSLE